MVPVDFMKLWLAGSLALCNVCVDFFFLSRYIQSGLPTHAISLGVSARSWPQSAQSSHSSFCPSWPARNSLSQIVSGRNLGPTPSSSRECISLNGKFFCFSACCVRPQILSVWIPKMHHTDDAFLIMYWYYCMCVDCETGLYIIFIFKKNCQTATQSLIGFTLFKVVQI